MTIAKIGTFVGALALVALLLVGYGCYERKVGELNGKLAHLEQEKARVDTVYRTDTLRLTKTYRVTDSILAVDTVIHTDTVRVLIAQERAACRAVVLTCEQRVAIRDTIITGLRSRSSFKIGLPWGVGGVVIGALGGIVAGVALSK